MLLQGSASLYGRRRAARYGDPVTRRGWGYFVALGIIWGLPYLLIRVSVREISPSLLVFIRTGGAAVILVPLAAVRGALTPALRKWRPVVCFTVCELAVPWLLLFNAERTLPSSLSGVLVATVPIPAALLAWTTGTDHVDLRRVSGLVLGIGGVCALLGFGISAAQIPVALSVVVVSVGYATAPWVVENYLQDVPPIGVLALACTLCALGYAPAAALSMPTRTLSASVIGSAAGLTVLCTIVAFLLAFSLIREVGAMRTTLITYVNPVVAVALGVGVLHERFSVVMVAGFCLILVGCLVASRPAAVEISPRTPYQ